MLQKETVIVRHAPGQYLELYRPEQDSTLWRYNYAGKPKPYFHPMTTPAGFCLSLFEPHDHVWHRGLWFAIKFINRENFWEEGADSGAQRGLLPPTLSHAQDGAMTWTQNVAWERAHGAGTVFLESRTMTYRPLETDAYALDWDVALTAQDDLLLDRTEFTTWGGYGGLTLRGNRNWQQTQLLFSDGSTSDRPLGKPALWADLSGVFDGGSERRGGVAMFDHPGNIRHPSPWYGATGSGHYFNAAFLFHEPLAVSAGDVLHLRYRVLVHDEIWDAARLEAAYDAYTMGDADEQAKPHDRPTHSSAAGRRGPDPSACL